MCESILIVDDEQPVRYMVRRLLEGQGYTVAEAASGAHGLELADQTPVDLVITDLKMPGIDGLEMAQKLLDADPDRPVLLMTAFGDLDSARKAVRVGIYEYFTKPVDINDVLAGVHRALERRRLVQENRAYQRDLERKVAERTRELKRAYGELVQTEKLSAVGRLVAGVVHEVLDPLSVVAGRIEMVMMNGELGEPNRRSLQLAREQVDDAVKIMDNLRAFSRQRPPKRVTVHLNTQVAHTLELIAHESISRSIKVVKRLGDLPGAQADPDQLSQVFLNLAYNAMEAMPEGGCLTVETQLAAKEGNVEIRFTDTGTGIARGDLSHLFEPFFTTKKTGTGLGLPICLGIVEGHGGRIEVESRAGAGTTFVVGLPVKVGVETTSHESRTEEGVDGERVDSDCR